MNLYKTYIHFTELISRRTSNREGRGNYFISRYRGGSTKERNKAWAKAGKTGASPPAKAEAYPIVAEQEGADLDIEMCLRAMEI